MGYVSMYDKRLVYMINVIIENLIDNRWD